MNTNLAHNIINVLGLIVSLLAGFEFVDWTAWYTPETALKIVSGLLIAKISINTIRDGITGLVKPQPPVEK